MAERYHLFEVFVVFQLLIQAHTVSSVSFSFPPFDGKAKDLLVFQGSSNFSIANSSIKFSSPSSSQNSSGGRVLYSKPVSISTSLSFSSTFSFSVSEHVESEGFVLAFVVIASKGNASGVSSISSPLLSVELFNLRDLQKADSKSLSEIKVAAQKGGKIYGRVEYNGMDTILTASLSNTSAGTPLLRFPQVSFRVRNPNSEIYIGFDVANQNVKLHMWEFHSWNPSVHSMPFDPVASTISTSQSRENENRAMRSTTIVCVFVGIICVSLVMMLIWNVVKTAFGRSKCEISMHPIVVSCDEGNAEEKKALFSSSYQY